MNYALRVMVIMAVIITLQFVLFFCLLLLVLKRFRL